MLKMRSEILASVNLVTWIEEQPYIKMLFWQFYSTTLYFRVVGKMQEHHFMVMLFSYPGNKVKKKMDNYGKRPSPTVNKNWVLVPWIRGQQCIEMVVSMVLLNKCRNNISMYGSSPNQGTR